MSWGGRVFNGMNAGVLAFREAYFHGEDPRAASALVGAPGYNSWGRFEARRLRYDVNWSFWQNDAYRRIHYWSRELKAQFGLYKNTRHVYNPSRRIVEFFVCHVYNGSIDPAAGDGSRRPTAIPIEPDSSAGARQSAALAKGLSRLWRDSRLQSTKSTWLRYGAAMGDAPLAIVDEPGGPKGGTIRLEPWHPGILKWVDVKADRVTPRAYIREEMRYDPEQLKMLVNVSPRVDPLMGVITCNYTEVAEEVPGGVRYRTYRNGLPYDWATPGGDVAEWIAPYPCIPLVMTQHMPIGGEWGYSEIQADLPKVREVDDLASKLDDQVRKLVDSPWLFSGFTKADVKAAGTDVGAGFLPGAEEKDRERIAAFYAGNVQARAQALVSELDVAAVSEHIGTILEDIERDHPELRYDRLTVSGALSGTALRKARQGAETKVNERRAEYDHSLARAQEIALVIGGIQGYAGYADARAEDLEDGRFRHTIGDRTIFGVDNLERLEEEQAEATAAQTWVAAGVPLRTALVRVGWSADDAEAAGPAAEAPADRAQANPLGKKPPSTSPGAE